MKAITTLMQDLYHHLYQFLRAYKDLWQKEVLFGNPHGLAKYPKDWIDFLSEQKLEILYQLDSFQNFKDLPNGAVKDFYQSREHLLKSINIKQIKYKKTNDLLSDKEAFKITSKKRHEINQLLSFFKKIKNSPQELLDIGGGVGHLSRVITNKLDLKAKIVEANYELINKGIHHNKNYALKGNIEFDHNSFAKDYPHCPAQMQASIGLHTCGPLSLEHFKYHLKHPQHLFINIGCCYLKLDKDRHTNLSKIARKQPLPWTNHALTLAARSHSQMTRDEFLFKKHVKNYRYALDLFIKDHFGELDFIPVGDAPKRDYKDTFSYYAKNRLKAISLKSPGDHILNQYFESLLEKKVLDQLFCANILRWSFGRLLEYAILIDRICYLKENGVDSNLYAIFDESISPRNLMISNINLT